jgi:hypothetical protein
MDSRDAWLALRGVYDSDIGRRLRPVPSDLLNLFMELNRLRSSTPLQAKKLVEDESTKEAQIGANFRVSPLD